MSNARGAFFIILVSLPLAASAIDECAKTACDARKGTWSCAQQGIPGDGAVHDFSAPGGSRNAQFVCGQAASMRQGLDTGFVASCTLDPEQPPSIDNASYRRCAQPSDDLSVEVCVEIGGSSPRLSCRYVNPAGARTKTVQLCGCWK